MQGEAESLLEKFMVGINTVGKGRRQGDNAGFGAGNGGGAAPLHPHHGLCPGILQPTGKREEGIVSMSPSSTSSPEDSLGFLFKSPFKPRQISQCPFKTKTNSLQKILWRKVLTFPEIFCPLIFFPVSPIHSIWH